MSDGTQTILYILRHVDIGGHIEIPYKKIGITGSGNATLTRRLQQISNQKSPIKSQCIAAWRVADARGVENALHRVLSNERVEGEWFYDADDDLVDRLEPILDLLKAEVIEIEDDTDSYTKSVLQKESDAKNENARRILGEVSEQLAAPLRTSIRNAGPTFFSDKSELTYYVNTRRSGLHNLEFGRSKGQYAELESFLQRLGYDVEQHARGHAMIHGVTANAIADIINTVEANYR